MASTETKRYSRIRGIGRLLHPKKDPAPPHPLLHPSNPEGPTDIKMKKDKGFAFRGLGCSFSSAASPEALIPAAAAAAVRSSADWQGTRAPKKRRGKKKKKTTDGVQPAADIADISDVWCAPGVVFNAEASVDCVVARRRERVHRERHGSARRGADEEIIASFLDSPFGMEMRHIGSGPFRSGHLRYVRGGYRHSPAEFDEMMMSRNRVFLGGVDIHDQYEDLRLDVDNMSYEELLALSERIGYVCTGLREEEILRNLRKQKHSFFGTPSSQREWKCIICQEEYEVNDEMGRLDCGHSYHTCCIKQWLLRKNACPVCKTAVTKA